MSLRWTSVLRPAVLRLGNDVSRRCFAKKAAADTKSAVTPTADLNKQFNVRTRTMLLNYINHLYRGHDKRLKSYQSAMDLVQKAKIEKGPFESLDDLTTKACLSVGEALGLCEEIAQATLKKRRNIQFSYPAFADSVDVESILAIHTSLYCVVWTHLEKTGRILSWHKEPLALGEKQKHTIDAVQAVMNLYNKIPLADAYIIETPDIRRTKDLSEANDGFLLSTINCSILATISCLHAKSDSRARIFYMNRTLVPLLFDLSVGMETVSRFRTVEDLIAKKYPLNYLDLRDITLDDWLKDLFTESNDKTKEELSIPLLAAIAAMEILVRQNPRAIEKVITS